MCGICGFVGLNGSGPDDLLARMSGAIVHRGPDDDGSWQDDLAALGHRRLSIIDLAGGHQPMTSPDGRYVIAFNGEIYNYLELRRRLEGRGHSFRTDSDTEVLLALFVERGERALDDLNGMFAFAVWDRSERELFLARDRVGIKPLYYVTPDDGRGLLFASETKALLEHDGWARDIDPHALSAYLSLRYAPGPTGLFKNVQRLQPGHWLRWRPDVPLEIGRYWAPPVPAGDESKRSEDDWLDELGDVMERAVRRRLISDVSFGAYLSGGLDSSLIVALMSKITSAPTKTFSVGFDYEHDELSEAKATAELLGCDHTEVACRAEHVNLLPEIVWHSDEPLGDAIAIPMYQLAREAKKKVTVILTGEGGDEVFGGYLFHKVMWAAHRFRQWTPRWLRRGVLQPLASISPPSLMNVAFRYPAYLGDRGKLKALDYLELLDRGDHDAEYRHLISLFDDRDKAGLFAPEFDATLRGTAPTWVPPSDDDGRVFDRFLRLQFGHWLPDNMLLRNDKMSMASAIEGRVPFLDHEVIEFGFRLPRQLRLRGMTGKYLLRRLTERLLPRETAQRRKMPFYVPMENYFQQPEFVALMDDLLSADSVRKRGLFRPEAVDELRGSMHQREFLRVKQVFSLMTLELWFRIFVDRNGKPL